jgi:hypothetical protein
MFLEESLTVSQVGTRKDDILVSRDSARCIVELFVFHAIARTEKAVYLGNG